MRAFTLLILVACWAGVARADDAPRPLALRLDRAAVSPAGAASWLEDPGGKLTVDAVARAAGGWRPVTTDSLSFGITSSTYWVRLPVTSTATERAEWLLSVENAWLDLELWRPLAAGGWSVSRASGLRPFAERELQHHMPLFPLRLGPGETAVYYLRVQARVVSVPLKIWSEAGFQGAENEAQLTRGLFYGIFAIMILYNLCIFVFVRDPSYLWYVVYVTAFALFWAAAEGLAFRYLWPNAPWWHDRGINAISCLGLAALLFFVSSLIDLKRRFPRLAPPMRALAWLNVVGAALIFSPDYIWSTYFSNYAGLVVLVFSTGVATWAAVKGSRPARLYLIALVSVVIGLIPYILQNLGLLASSFLTRHGPEAGMIMHVTMLSLTLADRINVMRNETVRLTRRALATQERLVKRLHLILETTKEMALAKNEPDAAQVAAAAIAGELFPGLPVDIALALGFGQDARELPLVAGGEKVAPAAAPKELEPESNYEDAPAREPAPASAAPVKLAATGTPLVVPVELKGQLKGALRIVPPAPDAEPPPAEDVKFVEALTSSLGITFENISFLLREVEKARVDAELKAAQAVQRDLLPKKAQVPGVELLTAYQAAVETGGDWYGHTYHEATRTLYLYIGDVTGHGIPSAIMTGVACGAVYAAEAVLARLGDAASKPEERLRQLARAVNDVMVTRGDEPLFMTMAFLSVQLDTGEVCVLNAGHCPVIRVEHESGKSASVYSPGDLLGLHGEATFGLKRFTLAPGDLLFLFTDGLTENHDRGRPKGLGTAKVVGAAAGAKDAAELHERLWTLGRGHWGEGALADDITTITLKWLGPAASADKRAG